MPAISIITIISSEPREREKKNSLWQSELQWSYFKSVEREKTKVNSGGTKGATGGEWTKPRGTKCWFWGKVAPVILMPVYNTFQNWLTLFFSFSFLTKMHVPLERHQTQDSKSWKYNCNLGAVVQVPSLELCAAPLTVPAPKYRTVYTDTLSRWY